jgi:hypothetical protein
MPEMKTKNVSTLWQQEGKSKNIVKEITPHCSFLLGE